MEKMEKIRKNNEKKKRKKKFEKYKKKLKKRKKHKKERGKKLEKNGKSATQFFLISISPLFFPLSFSEIRSLTEYKVHLNARQSLQDVQGQVFQLAIYP